MKTAIKNTILSIALTCMPFALNATAGFNQNEDIYDLPAYGIADVEVLPIPVARDIPVVPSGLVGTTIVMKITVDEFGIPTRVHSARPLFSLGLVNEKERDFAVQLSQQIAMWEFEPALDTQGRPVAATVTMPVTVIERNGKQEAMVRVILENNFKSLVNT